MMCLTHRLSSFGVNGGLNRSFNGVSFVSRFAALAGCWVLDESVDQSSFVIFRQVFRDGFSFRCHEEQTVAILVLLHLVAGAKPTPTGIHFCFLVGVVVARTKGSA